jgi:hypothetical protein
MLHSQQVWPLPPPRPFPFPSQLQRLYPSAQHVRLTVVLLVGCACVRWVIDDSLTVLCVHASTSASLRCGPACKASIWGLFMCCSAVQSSPQTSRFGMVKTCIFWSRSLCTHPACHRELLLFLVAFAITEREGGTCHPGRIYRVAKLKFWTSSQSLLLYIGIFAQTRRLPVWCLLPPIIGQKISEPTSNKRVFAPSILPQSRAKQIQQQQQE